MIIQVKDTNDEVFHINPSNIVYIKERPNHGLWKIVLVTDERVMTRDGLQIKNILRRLSHEENI